MAQHQKEAPPLLLDVWLLSGEKLTSVHTAELTDVRSLKRHLQTLCGKSRFCQRLLHETVNVDDDTMLTSLSTNVQLVLLPFERLSNEQNAALVDALGSGQVGVVEDMLLLPADPNSTVRQFSPITIAAGNGYEAIVGLLLEAGSALHADAATASPLLAACCKGRMQIVSQLLEAGADVDEVSQRGTPLTWAVSSHGQEVGQDKIVEMLLEARADVNKVDGDLYTPLLSAVTFGRNLVIVKLLLGALADTNAICPRRKQTPLCIASEDGDVALMYDLLTAGADRISARRTPLTTAVDGGHVEVVRALTLAGATVDMVDDEWYTPLTRALWGDNVDIVHLLLAARADVDMACPYTAQTPLCMACRTGRVEMVRLLLLSRADKDKSSVRGSPVKLAARAGHVEILRLLLIAGAEPEGDDYWKVVRLLSACGRSASLLAAACDSSHAWRKAVVLLEEMDRRSAKPDIVSYSTAVVACEKASEWAAALSLFSSLRKASVQVDAFGVSAALSACGKGGLWALALDMLAEMSDKSVTPDLFCLNGALSALGRAQLWEETLQHLQMLQSAEGVAPDAVSYNTAISASAESSRWPIALSLFQEMQERDVVPTTISFNAVISALMADTQDQAAAVEAVFAQMLEAKIGPDGKTFCVMIGAQGSGLHWQRAVDLLQEMHRNSLAHGEHDGDARQQVAEILVRSDKRELSQDVIRQAVADGVFKTLSQPEH
ncbi:mask [Symbiodinium sp. CCMP2592]|nr:mask [Symbiodinium sp. CCMP2592]